MGNFQLERHSSDPIEQYRTTEMRSCQILPNPKKCNNMPLNRKRQFYIKRPLFASLKIEADKAFSRLAN